jgi:hypothetical protein
MAHVQIVDDVKAIQLEAGPLPSALFVVATGKVPTSGWSGCRLSPRYYVTPPKDGVWDFDMLADEPTGIVAQVVLPISAHTLINNPPSWVRGIRVHSETNSAEASINRQPAATAPARFALATATRADDNKKAIFNQTIAGWDDSHQPTGTIIWINDGPFGTPNPHIEMKKLEHRLVLTVEGPDEPAIRRCVERAATAGLFAAIVAVVVTGGGALAAAIGAAIAELKSCLGGSAMVKIENNSHWVYWHT